MRLLYTALFLFSIHGAFGQTNPKKQVTLISPGEAASIAAQYYAGQVVATELIRPPQGSPYYRVKILSKGKVQVVTISAVR